MPLKKEFDLQFQFLKYCELTELKPEEMPADQLRETKRAFIGGCGQMLVLLSQDVATYPESTAKNILKDMFRQVTTFWKNEDLSQKPAP